jgi:hypothetical protein
MPMLRPVPVPLVITPCSTKFAASATACETTRWQSADCTGRCFPLMSTIARIAIGLQ